MVLTFDAKDVYLVAGTTDGQPANAGVTLPSPNTVAYGVDAPNGVASISGSKLYHMPAAGDTTVTLTVPKGVSLYTFTFGG